MPHTEIVRDVYITNPVSIGWTSTTVPVTISLSYLPSAAITNLYDRFVVKSVKLTFMAPIAQGTAYTNVPFVVCWDPSGTAITTPGACRRYENSMLIAPNAVNAFSTYTVKNPPHPVSGSAGSDFAVQSVEPLRTDAAWSAGSLLVAPFLPSSAVNLNLIYYAEYELEFTMPRYIDVSA